MRQLFNSEEQKIGGYKIQITTDPEIPGPRNPSRVLVAITDYDGNDLIDVMVGLNIQRRRSDPPDYAKGA